MFEHIVLREAMVDEAAKAIEQTGDYVKGSETARQLAKAIVAAILAIQELEKDRKQG